MSTTNKEFFCQEWKIKKMVGAFEISADYLLVDRAAPQKIPKVKSICRVFMFLIFLLPCFHSVYAQENNAINMEDLLNMSLEELMNVDVLSAAKVPQKMRETPTTIRIISADQIRERGYFTLEQALADLPGFQFWWFLRRRTV
jgi:hypothetical protein